MVSVLGLSALESAVLDRTSSAFVEGPGLILAIFTLMLLLGLVSCGPSVVRALRIQPTEAMRADV